MESMRADELIGQLLGHYRIIRPLGYGGTATVFLAEDINLQREVAVKVYVPGEGDTKDFLRRFTREARVLAQLDHPNILPVYDYGEQHGLAYLVMPRMAGGSLRDRLRTTKSIPIADALHLIEQILNALQYAHERGLIHRDIKPGNMLFKADGTLVLSDFGLVKVVAPTDDFSQTGVDDKGSITGRAIAGTPDYMPPEQIMGNVLPASDIYAVGAALYEMLTGTHVFTSDNYLGMLMKHLNEPPRPLRQLNPQVSPALEAVIMRTLAKDPAQRYQRPIDLLQAIRQATAAPPHLAVGGGDGGDGGKTIDAAWTVPVATPLSPMPPVSPTPSNPAHSPYEPSAQGGGEQKGYTGGMIIGAAQSTPITPSSPTQRAMPPHAFSPQQSYQAAPYAAGVEVAHKRKRAFMPIMVALAILIVLLLGSLVTALVAPQVFGIYKGSGGTPIAGGQTPVGGTVVKGGVTPPSGQPTVATANVPATTTNCPAAGVARAAVLAPLVLGNHQNLVYIVNEGTFDNPTFGTVKRRDVTASMGDSTLKGVEISKMAGVYISEAQVSQDGQWVLFTARVGQQYQLRMVRVDGQGLQTLYCAAPGNPIVSTQWSFDQKQVVFAQGSSTLTLYTLNLVAGQVQATLLPDANKSYVPRTWLDNSHVYLVSVVPNSDAPPQDIYLLDLQKGPNQHSTDLQKVVTMSLLCGSFDTDYNSTQLITATCTSGGLGPSVATGPSTIMTQPATGGATRTLLSNAANAIVMVRAISKTTLLVMVENSSGDKTQNGLWRVNMDGSGLTHLSVDSSNIQALCPFTQYAWSNVSRDGTLYALQSYDGPTHTYGMYYGQLSGGTPTQFAGISDGTQLFLVGWTTL